MTEARPGPPDDPEAWSDQQWLEWLQATDAEVTVAVAAPPRAPRSLGYEVARALMLGLHAAIYGPRKDEVAMVVHADGDPPGPDGIELELAEDPRASRVTLRGPRGRRR